MQNQVLPRTPSQTKNHSEHTGRETKMAEAKRCLMCKKQMIDHYGICPACTEFNEKMRNLTRDLTGKTAVVTGGRINIGYAVCMRLLRQNANVIAVTRYPNVALQNYMKEPDYSEFRDRLHIIGFDLTYVNRMDELLAEIAKISGGKIDILINNAAQTVRKSNEYYAALERKDNQLRSEQSGYQLICIKDDKQFPVLASMSPVEYGETSDDNSWVRKPADISTREMVEVQLINVTAPFILTTRIADTMMQHDPDEKKFIINVSSVEGKFMDKPARHLHTNMAKASLNMMTLTLANLYKTQNIYIYASDPGWVSNQFPPDHSFSKSFKAYLTLEDGAARVLYPIQSNIVKSKIKNAGSFYKDYKIISY